MSEQQPRVRLFADFNNADGKGRIRLNTKGALDDLAALRVELYDGMLVRLDDDDELAADGVVRYSEIEKWVAEIDWNRIEHRLEEGEDTSNKGAKRD